MGSINPLHFFLNHSIQQRRMKSKFVCFIVATILGIFIAPACSIAQFQTSSHFSAYDGMLEPNPSSPPAPYLGDTTPTGPAWNSIYAEALGSGLVYTLNYERELSSSFGLRLGFGYLPVSAEKKNGTTVSESATSAPLTLSWFPFGSTSSRLEVGAGLSYVDLTKSVRGFPQVNSIGYAGILGYRYEEEDGGFLFRADFTPIILLGGFYAWGGVGLGFGF
jgi:hypothetical protein